MNKKNDEKKSEKGWKKKRERKKKINGTEHVSAPCPTRCSVRLISIRFSGVAMVNAMQKRKKSRRGRVDVRESTRTTCWCFIRSR